MRRLRLLILASGSGSLTQSVIDAGFEIVGVISDVSEAPVLNRAVAAGIPAITVPFKEPRSDWNRELADTVALLSPDLVVSLGFMRILSGDFLSKFRVINSHPALLPKFPGAHAVRDALAAGAIESGCTIHWVDEGIDTGAVIAQRKVAILPEDDVTKLHERIKIIERELIVETLQNLEQEFGADN